MNIYRLALIAAATVAISAAYAGDSVTNELKANYTAMTNAFLKKDIKPIDAFLAKDFFVQDMSGQTVQRAKILTDYQNQMNLLKDVSWGRKILGVTKSGATTFSTVEGTVKGSFLDKNQKSHKLLLIATAKDSWTKSGGKWLLHKTVVLTRKATIDGKATKMR